MGFDSHGKDDDERYIRSRITRSVLIITSRPFLLSLVSSLYTHSRTFTNQTLVLNLCCPLPRLNRVWDSYTTLPSCSVLKMTQTVWFLRLEGLRKKRIRMGRVVYIESGAIKGCRRSNGGPCETYCHDSGVSTGSPVLSSAVYIELVIQIL